MLWYGMVWYGMLMLRCIEFGYVRTVPHRTTPHRTPYDLTCSGRLSRLILRCPMLPDILFSSLILPHLFAPALTASYLLQDPIILHFIIEHPCILSHLISFHVLFISSRIISHYLIRMIWPWVIPSRLIASHLALTTSPMHSSCGVSVSSAVFFQAGSSPDGSCVDPSPSDMFSLILIPSASFSCPSVDANVRGKKRHQHVWCWNPTSKYQVYGYVILQYYERMRIANVHGGTQLEIVFERLMGPINRPTAHKLTTVSYHQFL